LIKLLQADNFYNQTDVDHIFNCTNNLQYIEKEHGFEIDQFNLVIPGLDSVFSKFVGEEVYVDEENSGIFRKPNLRIHFEGFDSMQEWIFILALEPTTFNLYHHLSGAKNALDEYRFDYNNLFDWDIHTNILLEPNQGIIFRPWLFHSLTHQRLVQLYRLKGKDNG
jgi:hypothetical protein